jgi:hypothetical protein
MKEDVDGRDKPGHDGEAVFMGSGLRPSACPGMTAWCLRKATAPRTEGRKTTLIQPLIKNAGINP